MTDLSQNNYPKSSCNCYNCMEKNYNFHVKGYPTNIALRDCSFSKYYDCQNTKLFKSDIEPKNNKNYYPLNANTLIKSYDKSFSKAKPDQTRSYGDLNNDVYITNDPRLYSVPLGQVLPLNVPPVNEGMNLKDIYTDPSMKDYGKRKYKDYKDVNAGQIVYYIDEEIADPLYEPIFTNNAHVDGYIYKDPMGSIKPQYIRIPVKKSNLLETLNDNNHGELTWMRDSQESREDLMSYQMSKFNQRKYSSRWNGDLKL